MKIFVLAAAALALASCGGVNYAVNNYSGVKAEIWTSPSIGTGFRIYDKPSENRLMIALDLGGAALQGFGKGITLGAADTRTPEIIYQDAAIEWLAAKGRSCIATNTFLVLEPQYEVRYECSPPETGGSPPAAT